MSKTLLDHLIETTVRLTPYAGSGAAEEHARRIVTEFAGPPCADPAYSKPGRNAECAECRWPRSEHGRAK